MSYLFQFLLPSGQITVKKYIYNNLKKTFVMSMTHFNWINKGYVKVTLPKKNIYIYIFALSAARRIKLT